MTFRESAGEMSFWQPEKTNVIYHFRPNDPAYRVSPERLNGRGCDRKECGDVTTSQDFLRLLLVEPVLPPLLQAISNLLATQGSVDSRFFNVPPPGGHHVMAIRAPKPALLQPCSQAAPLSLQYHHALHSSLLPAPSPSCSPWSRMLDPYWSPEVLPHPVPVPTFAPSLLHL